MIISTTKQSSGFIDYHFETQNELLFQQVFAQAPTLSEKSNIIDPELLLILYSNNLYTVSSEELTLLHSSANEGMSLNTIQNNILGYDSQTLIILRSGKNIFGGFNNKPWKDQKDPQGDDHCFVFSLTPDFKVLGTSKGKGVSRCFTYLNTKSVKHYEKYKAGIGFGGNSRGTEFQLWIDEIIYNKSYISKGEECFEEGWLIPDGDKKANFDGRLEMTIDAIEVWGIGNDENLQNQVDRKKRSNCLASNANKVNKKVLLSLLSDFDKQFFFTSTFSHVNEIRSNVMDCYEQNDEDPGFNPEFKNVGEPIFISES